MKNDPVNHPAHYTSGKIEVADFIDDQKFNYRIGNVVKYLSRYGKKDPTKKLEDLKKAEWYLQREIQIVEKEMNNVDLESKCVITSTDASPKTDRISWRDYNSALDDYWKIWGQF